MGPLIIDEIRPLTNSEYVRLKDRISIIDEEWWLIPDDPECQETSMVDCNGDVSEENPYCEDIGYRPALFIRGPVHPIGARLTVFGYEWVMISLNIAICSKIIKKIAYYREKDALGYEESSIYAWTIGYFKTLEKYDRIKRRKQQQNSEQ